jgi:hypothetical protein
MSSGVLATGGCVCSLEDEDDDEYENDELRRLA